jgi:uncharacterized integral membrane protein
MFAWASDGLRGSHFGPYTLSMLPVVWLGVAACAAAGQQPTSRALLLVLSILTTAITTQRVSATCLGGAYELPAIPAVLTAPLLLQLLLLCPAATSHPVRRTLRVTPRQRATSWLAPPSQAAQSLWRAAAATACR